MWHAGSFVIWMINNPEWNRGNLAKTQAFPKRVGRNTDEALHSLTVPAAKTASFCVSCNGIMRREASSRRYPSACYQRESNWSRKMSRVKNVIKFEEFVFCVTGLCATITPPKDLFVYHMKYRTNWCSFFVLHNTLSCYILMKWHNWCFYVRRIRDFFKCAVEGLKLSWNTMIVYTMLTK